MTVALAGVPAQITNLLQDRTLERVFHDALYPRLLYRAEAIPELWVANLGERMVFTRAGLIPVSTKPLVPGQDPTPKTYASEQWEAEARQHGDTIDTHMPSSYVMLASLFLRNAQTLGLNAARTLARLTRNPLYAAYLSGESMVRVAAAPGVFVLSVSSINGFTQQLQNGRLQPVSPLNPLPVSFSTAGEPDNTVVGVVPDNPNEPLGGGLITLGAATTGAIAARAGVFSATRARRLRVGGGATVDAITSADIITLNDIIAAVARLRGQNVPPHADGMYHVHLTPNAEAQLFQDNHWQRLHQSMPDSAAYRDLAIGQAVGCYFYRNTENPDLSNCQDGFQADPGGGGGAQLALELGAELTTEAGFPIGRAIVTAGGALYEKYLDESKYITEAGVTGKIGEFSIVNGGVAVMAKRIRYILRSPQDRLQQVVSQTWSWSGDFPVPSDQLSGDTARFKRAIVIEHAGI